MDDRHGLGTKNRDELEMAIRSEPSRSALDMNKAI